LRWNNLILAIYLFVSASASAQLWTNVIDPTRAYDWTGVGVRGGIPSRTQAACQTVSLTAGAGNATANATAINNAISACSNSNWPTGKIVSLPAGTYYTDGFTWGGSNNVTVRGAGAGSTKLISTSTYAGCQGEGSIACLGGNDLSYYGQGPPSNIVNFTGTNGSAGVYTQGATVLNFDSSTNLSAGMLIVVDQTDDTAPQTNEWTVCGANSSCAVQYPSGGALRTSRALFQWMFVVSCSPSCGYSGATAVTVSQGLAYPSFRSGQTPQAWWGDAAAFGHGNSLEDVTIDLTADTALHGIQLKFTYDSWLRGVATINGTSTQHDHVQLYEAPFNTVEQGYMYLAGAASGSYGVQSYGSSYSLVQDNICQQIASCWVNSNSTEDVAGYNFAVNDLYTVGGGANMQGALYYSHAVGSAMNMGEGNIVPQMTQDDVEGTSNAMTMFRNASKGWETGKTQGTGSIRLASFARYANLIGNVMGIDFLTLYQWQPGDVTNKDLAVFDLGGGGGPTDNFIYSSTFRWGNYDTVSGLIHWCGNSSDTNWTACTPTGQVGGGTIASEVPTGLTKYSNAIPTLGDTTAGQGALPTSFYLSSKPSWWSFPSGNSSTPWPSVGPDVSSGNVGKCSGGTYDGSPALSSGQCTGGSLVSLWGGHVYANPAMNCYLNVMTGPPDGTGSALTFDRATCYPATGSSTPNSVGPGMRVSGGVVITELKDSVKVGR